MQVDLNNPRHIMALASLAIEGNQVAIKLLELYEKERAK